MISDKTPCCANANSWGIINHKSDSQILISARCCIVEEAARETKNSITTSDNANEKLLFFNNRAGFQT